MFARTPLIKAILYILYTMYIYVYAILIVIFANHEQIFKFCIKGDNASCLYELPLCNYANRSANEVIRSELGNDIDNSGTNIMLHK